MLEILAWFLVLPPAAMLAWYTAEVLCGLRPLRVPHEAREDDCMIVIPAHDEEAGIADTLAELTRIVAPDRILVVVDNCTDRTAGIARTAGVRVVERSDLARRGKGYALAFARDVMRAHPPAAVMVLDADCRIVHGEPARLAVRALRNGAAVQAENLQLAPDGSGPLARIGAFAFLVMNLMRSRGLARLGGGAVIQGTGWTVPWHLFDQLALATGDPVEDIGLTMQLARRGIRVLPDAGCRVASISPGDAAHLSQRARWERGSLRAVRSGCALLASGLLRGSRLQAAIGAHYAVPPIAFLAAAATAILLPVALLGIAGALSPMPAMALAGALVLALAATAAAWGVGGRGTVDPATLMRVPAYIAAKLPIYFGLARRGQHRWVRAERPPHSPPDP